MVVGTDALDEGEIGNINSFNYNEMAFIIVLFF